MRSSANHFVNAVHWSVAISLATLFMQLGITAVVARLLTPTDFGLYAIANIAFVLAMHIADRGLVSAITREPSLSAEVVGSTLLLSGGISILLAGLVFVLAPWASSIGTDAAGDDHVRVLLQLISGRILVAGFGTPAQALMQREVRFRDLGFIQSAGLVIGTGGITVLLAFYGQGPNSLFWGDFANSAIVSAACWWCVRDRWSTSWTAAHVARIGHIGFQMTTLRVLDVLWTQVPLLVAKAYLGPSAVGLYQRSQTLVDLGIQYSTGRVNAVLFPTLASRQHRGTFLRDLIPPLVGLYSLFLFSTCAFVAVTSQDIVRVLLGPAWADAARTISWIMIAFAILHVSQPASCQLEVRAFFRPRTISSSCGAICLLVASLCLVESYGLQGIAAAAVLSAITASIINFVGAWRYLNISLLSVARWMIPGIGVSVLLSIVLDIFHTYLLIHVASPLMRLGMTAAVAGVVMVIGFRLLLGEERREVLSTYISRDVPRFTSLIVKLMGVHAAKAQPLEERSGA